MREQEIYLEAIRRRDLVDRQRYLDEACGANQTLRERLDLLIEHSEEVASFLESPPAECFVPATAALLDSTRVGSMIGPYKLLQEIGQGGMGLVYMAEQTEPVRRRVALKVIKPGMDTRQVIARFEAERQALSLMDHPHIARVLDAGATDSGRPYFVMELVKGLSITRYCDERHLTPRERLELLAPVCQAIQHAHQKGIIHRDIKPSNVLVAEYDGKPVPKVIDFGVAKAISQPLTERTMFTDLGQIIGTLEYMSPEQAHLNQLDIDTRSDIYSLGVLLYELLTGTTPIDKQRLRSAAWDEMLRIIREEEPPRPSTRLSSCQSLPSIAAQRGTEPRKLRGLVLGELDWIVMKALEKDRARRYETADALANDLRRFLSDEPVDACPPTTAYRLRKFLRRHRLLAASLSTLSLSLLVATTGSLWGYHRAETARREAVQAQRETEVARQSERRRADAEQAARQEAQRERSRAVESEADTAVFARFLVEEILAAPRLKGRQNGQGVDVTIVELLTLAEPRLTEVFGDRWRAEATTRHALGVTWRQLGRYADAARHFRKALDLLEPRVESNAPLLRECRNSLAVTLASNGEYPEALELFQVLLRGAEAQFGTVHPETIHCRLHIADMLLLTNDLEAAQSALERIVADLAANGQNHHDRLVALGNLGAVQMKRRDFRRAYDTYASVKKEFASSDKLEEFSISSNMAIASYMLEQPERGFSHFRDAVLVGIDLLGPDHPELEKVLKVAMFARRARQTRELAQLYAELLSRVAERHGVDGEQYVSFKRKCDSLNSDGP